MRQSQILGLVRLGDGEIESITDVMTHRTEQPVGHFKHVEEYVQFDDGLASD